MKRSSVPALLLAAGLALPAVPHAQPAYPQEYFRNPLAIPIKLAGNFGECRPGHFHSGMDIKTNGVENLPVYAAADGYISRIKMEPGGFGHALYVTHPNGYTTLYAHLNNFIPAVQQYVRREQYARERWTVDLPLPPGQFPVKKGAQIAFSGNTGGSTAPHLHFEIRDTKTEHPLNPQLFGFAVTDTRPPVPAQLAVYQYTDSDGFYSRQPRLYPLTLRGGRYRPAKDTLFLTPGAGRAEFGLVVNDFMDGSTNTLAFYTAEWFVDDQLQGRIRLDNIGYEETRYVNAYADYRTKQQGGPWVQCLFRLPGNGLGKIYEQPGDDAALTDGQIHAVRISVTDAYDNSSSVTFNVLQRGAGAMGSDRTSGCTALRPGRVETVNLPDLSFSLPEDALYDNVCLEIASVHSEQGFSPRYRIGVPSVPVHSSFELRLRADKFIPFALRDKVAMIYSDGKKETGRAAGAEDKGWYKASVRAFGEYYLKADTTAPVIRPAQPWKEDQRKARRLSFTVRDAVTSVRSLRGTLDGRWILFEQHEDSWFYELDAHCPPGRHELVLTAADENGNEARAAYNFVR